jgi:hypothetical protein
MNPLETPNSRIRYAGVDTPLFMPSPARERASGTHIHPYAPPSVEHTDNRIYLGSGEMQAQSDQIRLRPARAAGYRMPATGRFNGQAGTEMGSMEAAG